MVDERFHVFLEKRKDGYYEARMEQVHWAMGSGKTEEAIREAAENLIRHSKDYLFANFMYSFDNPDERKELPWILKAIILNDVDKNIEQINVRTLIAKHEEADLKIFGEINRHFNFYDEFHIFHKCSQMFRFWKSDAMPSFLPDIFYEDINGDEKKEIVVVCNVGHGTGVSEEEVHVLHEEFCDVDGEQHSVLDEKLIENPLIAIHKSGKIKDVPTNEPYIGQVVNYRVNNNRLEALVGVQIGFLNTIGAFNVTYEYKNDVYQVKSIFFEGGE